MWFLFFIYPAGLLSLAIAILLLKYFYDVYSKSGQILENNRISKLKFYFYTFINGLIIVVWLLFAVENSPYRNKISDHGVPYGGVLLLVLVPLCFFISYFLKTDTGNDKKEFYRYITLSKFLWLLSLIPGAVVVLFYGLLMLSDR
jgi:hypothetical protein